MKPTRLLSTVAAVVATAGALVAAPSSAVAAVPDQHVIVRSSTSPAALRALVARVGGTVDRPLALIHGVLATVPASAVATLRTSSGVLDVTADSAVRLAESSGSPLAAPYVPSADPYSLFNLENATGVRSVWARGYTGRGVDVALIDSGVARVPGLTAGNVVLGPDLTEESQNPATDQVDTFGHGTHLAGIIAGRDTGALGVTDGTGLPGNRNDFLGVAPGARVVSVKVADSHGVTDVSQVIAGIDWVVAHAHDNGMNIRVMNLSFGTDSQQPYTIDPLAYAAEQAWKHGIVVVTSAGNAGDAGGLSDPADDPFVLAVGASDPMTNAVAPFSSTGDGSRNPDLVAPGVHVQSLRAPDSYIDGRIGSNGAINSRFDRGSGTSQAAAFVSGAVALMLQMWPSLTPDLVKYLLKTAACRIPNVASAAQGSGQLSLRIPPMYAWRPFAPQNFTPSTGTGSLDASRGSAHVTITDPTSGASVDVTGERDIFGNNVDTAALAALEQSASAWDGGSFNGAIWTGDGWTSSSWASSSWASSSWASSSWASSSWASSSWASSSWASSSWASSSWASSSWAAGCWC